MGYDANGLLKWKRSPKGDVSSTSVQDDYTTTYIYDPKGSGQVNRTSRRLTAAGPTVRLSTVDYDIRGNPVMVTDGTDRQVRTDFDILNRKVATVVDPNGTLKLTTSYTYKDDLLDGHNQTPISSGTATITTRWDGRLPPPTRSPAS